MGGGLALLRWPRRYVRRLLCGRDADARRLGESTTSGRDLSLRHRDGILRGMDVRRWRADAMVREFLDVGTDGGHRSPADRSAQSFEAMGRRIARRRLPPV